MGVDTRILKIGGILSCQIKQTKLSKFAFLLLHALEPENMSKPFQKYLYPNELEQLAQETYYHPLLIIFSRDFPHLGSNRS
jgi:hypothetical protein